MAPRIIDAAVNYLFRFSSDCTLELAFYGGEPLLNFTGLKHATKLAKTLADKTRKDLTFVCITNGTLIDTDKAEYFAKNRIYVQVSCDGPDQAHDAARIFATGRGSSSSVRSGIGRLKSAGVQYGLMATIGQHNCEISRVCSYLSRLGPFAYSLSSQSAGNVSARENQRLKLEVQQMEHAWLSGNDRTTPIHIQKLGKRVNDCVKLWFGCGAGIREFTIDVDGRIWPCERFAGTAGPSIVDALRDGVIPTDLYDGFLIDVDSRKECRRCWAKHLCGGGCRHNALASSPSTLSSSAQCELFRAEAEVVLQKLLLSSEGKAMAQEWHSASQDPAASQKSGDWG
jgi:uncharacterized protein